MAQVVRFMFDCGHVWPLWEDGTDKYAMEPSDYGLSQDLTERLQSCYEFWETHYGPDYTDALPLLRDRNLGKKRQLARREHGLGLEALTAFVDHAPLWKVHQAAILALESEPVDPRLRQDTSRS